MSNMYDAYYHHGGNVIMASMAHSQGMRGAGYTQCLGLWLKPSTRCPICKGMGTVSTRKATYHCSCTKQERKRLG